MQAIGTEGALASGPLTMQGLGVNGEVYCALLPDRFVWSQTHSVDAHIVPLASVLNVDVHDGGFELELCGEQGGATSRIQLHVDGHDAAAAEAGPRLAKMRTEDLRHARQVDQELVKWEEALHKVDWAAQKQEDRPFVQARSQSARNVYRSPAEGRPSGQARSPSPRRGHRGPAQAGPPPQAGGSPRDATRQSAEEPVRCQGRLGFSVQGTLQWRYAVLFSDRLDAWDSKEAATAGQKRGACPPVRIVMSTCHSLGFVDQGFLLKCSSRTHGVHVGPDQDDLARWSSALASTVSLQALASPRRAPSPAAAPRVGGLAAAGGAAAAPPGRQQPKQSSERGSSPSPLRAASATGRRAAPKLDRSITLRKDEALYQGERPRRAKA